MGSLNGLLTLTVIQLVVGFSIDSTIEPSPRFCALKLNIDVAMRTLVITKNPVRLKSYVIPAYGLM